MNPDILMYFDSRPEELEIYEVFEAAVLRRWPGTEITVHKTQVSFHCRRIFACTSIPMRRRKDWPEHCLMISLGLPVPPESGRIAQSSLISAHRYTCHIPLAGADEIDDEFLGWLDEAHAFADRPGRKLY